MHLELLGHAEQALGCLSMLEGHWDMQGWHWASNETCWEDYVITDVAEL